MASKDSPSVMPAPPDVKTLLKSPALYQYILDTTVLPNEPECMRELRLLTEKEEPRIMASSPDEAQLLGMLVKITGAKNTIEVGVYMSHSLLATARDDGKVVAIDTNRDDYDRVGRRFVEMAGVEHKVDFCEGPALDHLADGEEINVFIPLLSLYQCLKILYSNGATIDI